MNPTLALLRREWMQHRFAWLLMATIPTALMLLLVSFGQIELGDASMLESRKAAVLSMAGLMVPSALHLTIFWVTALIIMTGLARRDHADRSVEFWLSLPIGHAQSLAIPLLVHLLLAPLAALLAGLLSGLVVALALALRFGGSESLGALPWPALLTGALALAGRLALGTVLATLWLLPLILGVIALGAWFGKWGLVIGAVGLGLGSAVMDKLFGQPWLWDAFAGLVQRASRSIINAGGGSMREDEPETVENVLRLLPHWLAGDALQALGLLASPWLVAALALSAGLFAVLVHWRRQGAVA
jgi:ABC-2 type transport system permease protein